MDNRQLIIDEVIRVTNTQKIIRLVPITIRDRLKSSLNIILFNLKNLLYRSSLFFNNSLTTQVKLLPQPINPFIVWLDINKIELQTITKPKELQKYKGSWAYSDDKIDNIFIRDRISIFDIDLNSCKEIPDLIEDTIPNTVHSLFVMKENYSNTLQFRWMINAINNSNYSSPHDCKTINDVHSYFKSLCCTYESIKKNGYKSSKDLNKNNGDDIELCISNRGDFIHVAHARHRLLIAEILEIKFVPVNIVGISQEWLFNLCKNYSLAPHLSINKWINETDYIFNDNPIYI